MAKSYHETGGKLKRKDGAKKRDGTSAEKKRGPGLGSRAPKVAFR